MISQSRTYRKQSSDRCSREEEDEARIDAILNTIKVEKTSGSFIRNSHDVDDEKIKLSE